MQIVLQDLRFALRQLRKNPVFAMTAMLTLALGIGANTAVFTVLHGTLSLPYPHSERLVSIESTYTNGEHTPVSYPDFQDWRRQSQSFELLGASFPSDAIFLGKHEPVRIPVSYVSKDFFALVGLKPTLGRTFLDSEHEKGAAGVCVVNEKFWKEEMDGSRTALGQTASLDGKPYTVVGVVPRLLPSVFDEPALWIPLEAAPPYDQHGTNYLVAFGRLKPGVTRPQAGSELGVIQQQIDKQFPDNRHGIAVKPLSELLFGSVRSITLILLAAVGFILLIACVNLANMLLARATDRMHEFATRTALGASPARLLRQSVTESLFLSVAGGSLGMLFALAVLRVPLAAWPSFLKRPDQVALDPLALGFTAALAVATGLFFGIIPMLRVMRPNFHAGVQEGRTVTESRQQQFMRSALVVAEIAFATLLVAGALHMTRYFSQLLRTDPGVNPDHVLSMRIALSPLRYAKPEQQRQFFDSLLDRMKGLPGVEAASVATYVPFIGQGQTADFKYEGGPGEVSRELPFAELHYVLPDYLRVVQTPLLSGRFLESQDQPGSPSVVVINRAMAERLWPNQTAIGKRVELNEQWHQVVGVIGDVHSSSVANATGFQMYFSADQHPRQSLVVLLRTSVPPLTLVETAKSAVYGLDPLQPVSDVSDLQSLAERSLAGERISTAVTAVLGGLALLLASIGVYGVMAYSVSRRQREFGVRMAFGAQRRDILALLLRRSLYLAIAGVFAGALLSAGVGEWVRLLLAAKQGFGGAVLAASGLLLATVAMVATYIPARRAASTEPMQALRTE